MKKRVVTALAILPPVLLTLTSNQIWPIILLATTLVILGVYELGEMFSRKSIYAGIFLSLPLFAKAMVSSPRAFFGSVATFGLLTFFTGLLGTFLLIRTKKEGFNPFVLMAAGWVIGPIESLLALHRLGLRTGADWNFFPPVLLATVPVWIGDTAAILVGRAFGKHPLAPDISPNKTWEGSVANLMGCVIASVPIAVLAGYRPIVGLGCGLAAGIFGQWGDLFESYVKRQLGVKDSGNLLPGHGGIMDRMDSIFFTAPIVALILAEIR